MTTSARELAKKRSALRWRMSHLALAALGLAGVRAAGSAFLRNFDGDAAFAASLHGIVRTYQPLAVEGYYWAVGTLVVALVLSGVQLYFVSGSSFPARRKAERCPECRGRLRRHTIGIGKAAGQSFWACENNPTCGYSRRAPRAAQKKR